MMTAQQGGGSGSTYVGAAAVVLLVLAVANSCTSSRNALPDPGINTCYGRTVHDC